MPTYKAPLRDMHFLMNEVLDYPAHYARLSNGGEATPDMVEAMCDTPTKRELLKVGGGHGGHNGLRSIVEQCGGAGFARIRIGVGKPGPKPGTAASTLEKYAGNPSPDTLLLLILPKLDGTAQKAKWFVACENAGVSLQLPVIDAHTLPDWLSGRLQQAGLRTADAGGRTGHIYAPGIAELGGDPDRLLLVETPDPKMLLACANDAIRCTGSAAVIVESWGKFPLFDLTAGRRLALGARDAGTTLLMLRLNAVPAPSVAETRWSVAAAASRERARWSTSFA